MKLPSATAVQTDYSQRSRFDPRPNTLSVALDAARASGRRILDLTVSNPTTAGIPYDREGIGAALSDPRALRYEPLPFGLPEARQAVAKELGIDAARVMLTASTSEAYAFLFKLLCDPGDSVLVAQPSYPLFEHLAQFESVRLVPYPLAYDGAWHIDMDALERCVEGRTRAILIVNPNNPTGSFLKRWEYERLAEMGLPIVSDEVFATYPLIDDAQRVSSVIHEARGLCFALGGLSKLAALPQMKAAWIALGGPSHAAHEALSRLELIADSFLSVSTPIQLALPALLRARHTAAEAIVQRTRRNLQHLGRALAGSSATLLHVEGGWYATLRLPRTRSEEAWVLEFLQRGVYVHPGAFFDFAEEAFVIVSLLTMESDFDAGVERLVAHVDDASARPSGQ